MKVNWSIFDPGFSRKEKFLSFKKQVCRLRPRLGFLIDWWRLNIDILALAIQYRSSIQSTIAIKTLPVTHFFPTGGFIVDKVSFGHSGLSTGITYIKIIHIIMHMKLMTSANLSFLTLQLVKRFFCPREILLYSISLYIDSLELYLSTCSYQAQ